MNELINNYDLTLFSNHQDVPYMAVTGFIFLRFFVPAILSPKLFALREEHADQRTERTLKLTAKVIVTKVIHMFFNS